MEQFTRGENPFKSLRIGKRAQIDNWFKTWASDIEYEIDEDLNIRVKESLWFQETKVTSLPNNLHIEGYLNLNGSKITSLPDNLYVRGDLHMKKTKITFLPNDLIVGGEIYKDF